MSNLLHILYTANLNGDLDLLPRLHTFIRYLKALPVDDEADVMLCAVQPQTPRVLLLDLGNACAPDIWHCTATDGRSTLIALDAMGCTAANVAGVLTPESRLRLRDNLLGMALVDEEHDFHQDNLLLTVPRAGLYTLPPAVSSVDSGDKQPAAAAHSRANIHLTISLTPAAATHLSDSTLHLADVHAGQIGTAQISFLTRAPRLIAHAIFDVPPTTAPDPTLAAAVDFIQKEARFYSRNQSTT